MSERVVTLDPDNPDDVARLHGALGTCASTDWLANKLRSLLPEPPMPEPTGDVVVLDAGGAIWWPEEWRAYGGWPKFVRNHGPVTVYVAAAEHDAALAEVERLRAGIEALREVRARLDLTPYPREPHVVADIAEALDLAFALLAEDGDR